MKTLIRLVAGCALWGAFGLPSSAEAGHPFYVSHAEVEFNAKSGKLEVALCLWAEDIEQALGHKQKKAVSLEARKHLDRDLAKYVGPRFRVYANAKARDSATMHWVGHELERGKLWVYFEFAVMRPETCILENQVLVDSHLQQVNLVEVKCGKKKQNLIFTSARREARLLPSTKK